MCEFSEQCTTKAMYPHLKDDQNYCRPFKSKYLIFWFWDLKSNILPLKTKIKVLISRKFLIPPLNWPEDFKVIAQKYIFHKNVHGIYNAILQRKTPFWPWSRTSHLLKVLSEGYIPMLYELKIINRFEIRDYVTALVWFDFLGDGSPKHTFVGGRVNIFWGMGA